LRASPQSSWDPRRDIEQRQLLASFHTLPDTQHRTPRLTVRVERIRMKITFSDEWKNIFRDFGIMIEKYEIAETDEVETFLKSRFFATDEVKERCQFDSGKKARYQDTFYEQFDSVTKIFSFDVERFCRERRLLNGQIDSLIQISRNIPNECLISSHTDDVSNLVPFLQYEFYRLHSTKEKNVYLDQMISSN
jgi:hypothetical protein